jgi:hypothetical protein
VFLASQIPGQSHLSKISGVRFSRLATLPAKEILAELKSELRQLNESDGEPKPC